MKYLPHGVDGRRVHAQERGVDAERDPGGHKLGKPQREAAQDNMCRRGEGQVAVQATPVRAQAGSAALRCLPAGLPAGALSSGGAIWFPGARAQTVRDSKLGRAGLCPLTASNQRLNLQQPAASACAPHPPALACRAPPGHTPAAAPKSCPPSCGRSRPPAPAAQQPQRRLRPAQWAGVKPVKTFSARGYCMDILRVLQPLATDSLLPLALWRWPPS